ncbi:hypothetical protein Cgig2_019845 [Carnegiea gigantea]|uniref:ABC transporter domain-containing protein n=1 Tax=Carnegiea gigantea TaxID=171969 RepID=A0A9Q1JUE6_9CARY|nr:hypothetical protein Cgig2_019845 [Carnegiea gigantea]
MNLNRIVTRVCHPNAPPLSSDVQHPQFIVGQPHMMVGLTDVPFDKDPQSLSGGYKRRLALAIQLVKVPDLLILDEPLAGLEAYVRSVNRTAHDQGSLALTVHGSFASSLSRNLFIVTHSAATCHQKGGMLSFIVLITSQATSMDLRTVIGDAMC